MSVLFSSAAEAQTFTDVWLSVKTGPAAVLLDPSSSSVVVATVAVGTRVQAQRIQGGWYLVRVPKAADQLAPVSGWVPAVMLSATNVGPQTVTAAAPQAQAVVAGPAPSNGSAAPQGLLTDLRSQRDKVETAIRALEGVADAQTLRVKRDKLDRAIQATEALSGSEAVVSTETRSIPMTAARSQDPLKTAGQVTSSPAVPFSAGPRLRTRKGFWFSGGLGVGSGGCDNCSGVRETGLSGGLSLGATLNEKLLLGGGTTGWAKTRDGETVTIGTLDARLRFYPSRTSGFFLTGGLGLGTLTVDGETETGLGAVVGIGWDIRVGSNVSLTPFYNGFAMRSSLADANVGQLGLAITIH